MLEFLDIRNTLEDKTMENIKEHNIVLLYESISLRPMNENDWELLYKWNNDREVLYYTEGEETEQYSMEDMQEMYRFISQNAYCFIIEYNNYPIGECWLQQLNLPRLIQRFPAMDCRRIDLMIGEKEYWSKGLGTRIIMLLTKYGFEQELADYIFGCDIADYNIRSFHAFEKAGYELYNTINQGDGHKAKMSYDVMISRDKYENLIMQEICRK